MKKFRKILLWLTCILVVLYAAVCVFFYSIQDKILFIPTKLDAHYAYQFPGQHFTEYSLKMTDDTTLSGVLFRADSSKGLIFYLHGNAGALNTWGDIAPFYTKMGYDIFIPDYRGYGKSQGHITSEKQLYNDVQKAYSELCKLYPENKITILGYSIGTGPAAWLAARNHPHMLVLQAPYYSITDMMRHEYPFLPTFLLRYPLQTYKFVRETKCPITIFHGDVDEVLYYGSSLKLKELFKTGDTLITLKGQGHNGFTKNPEYLGALEHILGQK